VAVVVVVVDVAVVVDSVLVVVDVVALVRVVFGLRRALDYSSEGVVVVVVFHIVVGTVVCIAVAGKTVVGIDLGCIACLVDLLVGVGSCLFACVFTSLEVNHAKDAQKAMKADHLF
jgi:hypothetical protein